MHTKIINIQPTNEISVISVSFKNHYWKNATMIVIIFVD